MGSGSVLRRGDVQRMTAGTGVTHSEYNASHDEPVHFLQIWIVPSERGLKPGYEERRFDDADKHGRLCLVAAPAGEGALTLHQDARLFAATVDAGGELAHDFATGRRGWLQLARGAVELKGERLAAGDGAAIEGEARVALRASQPSELLLFDLA
jgi:redox-sensitive bicupin YhaK (pirin superfamily)